MAIKSLNSVALMLILTSVLMLHSPSYAGFTDIGANLTGDNMAWGDYDNDGDLDLATVRIGGGFNSKIYRNDNGVFTDIGAALVGVSGPVAWGDYDNDGDLDLALTGAMGITSTGGPVTSRIYRNDAGSFIDIAANLTPVDGSLAWGDYDNDGDLDLALAGNTESEYVSKIYRNNEGSFVDSGISLPAIGICSLAWGDYDNDGDLDLALSGRASNPPANVSKIYRNDNGVFTDIQAGLLSVCYSSLAWGDYDNDGDLDLALTGYTGSSRITGIYRNNNGSFSNIGASLAGVGEGCLAWGDHDNDGDLDLALTGYNGTTNISKIYRNTNGTFTDSGINLLGVCYSSLAWGDYDNDGDLDLAIYGTSVDGIRMNRVYRNDNPPAVNTPPASPTGLSSSSGGNNILLSWNAATDMQTPSAGLSYNIRVGTAPGKDDIFCGMANPTTGSRLLPAVGNAQKRLSWKIKCLPRGTYYWSVQAVDSAYAGSSWAAEQSLPVNSWRISGNVRSYSGVGVAGAVITIDDGSSFATSDSNGHYQLWVMNAWSGSVTPSKIGCRFTPAKRSYSNVSLDHLAEDYDCLTFTDVNATIPGVQEGSLAWGDYDKDGDMDLALAGYSAGSYICKIYSNSNSTFVDSGAVLTGVRYGALAWGDYDSDGDLDLAVAGSTASATRISKIYKNNGFLYNGVWHANFVDSGINLPGLDCCSLAWGDYDNDGDLDLALAGNTGSTYLSAIYRKDGGTFVDAGANLPGTTHSCLAWADYDSDGDLDLALAGYTGSSTYITRVYRSDNGVFSDAQVPIPGIQGAVAWGDYDNDGDFDLALAGYTGSSRISEIYQNNNNSFSNIGASLAGVSEGSLAWGDCDNDGDLDLAYTGYDGAMNISGIYRNDAGSFVDSGADIQGVSGPVAWADYDKDGRLDLALLGITSGTACVTKLYHNEYTTTVNTAPTAPSGLSTSADGNSITFSWTAASDAQTPSSGLSYNIKVSRGPSIYDIFTCMSDTLTGLRKLPATGNAQKKLSWTCKNLPSDTLYWSVQAIDTAYTGSPWAVSQRIHNGVKGLKAQPDGVLVNCSSVVISTTSTNYFYVETTDRFFGIRVAKTGHGLVAGTKVNVSGFIWTNTDGERYIAANAVSTAGSGLVTPLGMRNISLGGGRLNAYTPGVKDGIGLNNIGLLVKVYGRVTQVSAAGGYLYIDDGSGLDDGTSTDGVRNKGVRVICNPSGYAVGDYLVITGVSSCFKLPSGEIARKVLVTNPQDISRLLP